MALRKKWFSFRAFVWFTLAAIAAGLALMAIDLVIASDRPPTPLELSFTIFLPVSLCMLYASPIIGILGATGYASWHNDRTRRRLKGNRCVKCGYSLKGNVSGVCPECGQGVPSDEEKAAFLGD